MLAVADDVISDFGDAIGLVLDNDFEESLFDWLLVLFVSDLLSDAVALDLGAVVGTGA